MNCSNSEALTKLGIWLPKFNSVSARPFSFRSCGVIPKWKIGGKFGELCTCRELLSQFCKLCQISSWVAEDKVNWPVRDPRRRRQCREKAKQGKSLANVTSASLYHLIQAIWGGIWKQSRRQRVLQTFLSFSEIGPTWSKWKWVDRSLMDSDRTVWCKWRHLDFEIRFYL